LSRSATEKNNTATLDGHLAAPPATYITSPQNPVAPSPVNSDVTNFEDVDEEVEEEASEQTRTGETFSASSAEQTPAVISPRIVLSQQFAAHLRVSDGIGHIFQVRS